MFYQIYNTFLTYISTHNYRQSFSKTPHYQHSRSKTETHRSHLTPNLKINPCKSKQSKKPSCEPPRTPSRNPDKNLEHEGLILPETSPFPIAFEWSFNNRRRSAAHREPRKTAKKNLGEQ